MTRPDPTNPIGNSPTVTPRHGLGAGRQVWMPALVELAERQHGLVTTAQATRLGADELAQDHLLDSGRCHLVLPRVLRFRGHPQSWSQQVHAAVLSSGDEAAASHRTAAALHRFDGQRPGPIEITTLRWRRRRRRSGFTVHESTDLCPIDVTTVDGIAVTTPVRTLIDLGASAPFRAVEQALDGALRSGQVNLAQVQARYRELARQGRRGCGPIRQALELRSPDELVPASTFERRMLTLIRDAGLPEPERQFRVLGPDWVHFLDLAWPWARVAVECDSIAYHLGRREFEHDALRNNRITLEGWVILHYTWAAVDQRPGAVVTEIRAALQASGRTP